MRSAEGEYLKTVCDVRRLRNYDNAVINCHRNGMQLFESTSDEDLTAILTYAISKWPYWGYLWVAGEKQGDQCSRAENSGEGFYEIVYKPCSSLAYHFCEYRRKNKK